MNYCNGDKDTASTFCNPCPYEGNCEECDREKVIRHIKDEIENAKFQKTHYAHVSIDVLSDAITMLKKQGAQKFFVDESGKITPFPVVRCKDCAYWKDEAKRDKHPSWLPCMDVQTRDDFFCADGKMKEDE